MIELFSKFAVHSVLLWCVVSLLALFLLLKLFSMLGRRVSGAEKSHAEWTRELSFSPRELTVLRSLWQWQKTGKPTSGNPVSHLSAQEVASLMSKTGIDAMPPNLRADNEEKKRAELVLRFENIGMDAVEAEIAAGMIAGRLGPANDL